MNHNNNEEKTEQPTNYRLQKAKKEGIGSCSSRELNSILILLVTLIFMRIKISSIFFELENIMYSCLHFNYKTIYGNNNSIFIFSDVLKKIFLIFIPIIILLLLIIFISSWILNGRKLFFLSIKCNLTRLNPIQGLKKIFSLQVIIELFKAIFKIFFIMIVCSTYLWKYILNILSLLFIDNIVKELYVGMYLLYICCFLVILSMIPVVFFDVVYQFFNYYKNLRMSRQEIRDEFKQIEGNPLIKFRVRQLMKENIKRRMMIDLPKASVIITNPTHYAVALQYDSKKMNAPKVLAKGVGQLALKICKIGKKCNIPIFSEPVLARTLYRYTDIGQDIPSKLYTVVAEILAWVWKLERGKQNKKNKTKSM
ncbi:Flagellar biosynthetic protein FlhB [Buchnera aphidicola (Eriosoma lanigerum)]|uniref:flagellar biosynthesis protein FlhB n=1 Tax=Buchnera aphidicola TaxID=9 RepID=UPI003464CC51